MTTPTRPAFGYDLRVRWFMYFHTNTPIPQDGTKIEKTSVTIEAKWRPMIVLGRKWKVDLATAKDTGHTVPYPSKKYGKPNVAKVYEAEATLGFHVLPLQTSVPRKPALKAECLELAHGSIIPDMPSVVHLRPQIYPSCTMDRFGESRQLNSVIVDLIWEEFTRRGRDVDLEWDIE